MGNRREVLFQWTGLERLDRAFGIWVVLCCGPFSPSAGLALRVGGSSSCAGRSSDEGRHGFNLLALLCLRRSALAGANAGRGEIRTSSVLGHDAPAYGCRILFPPHSADRGGSM